MTKMEIGGHGTRRYGPLLVRGAKMGAAALFISLTGCMSYVKTTPQSVAPGDEVKVELTPDAFSYLNAHDNHFPIPVTEETIRPDYRTVFGKVRGAFDTGLDVEVPGTGVAEEEVRIPSNGIQEIDQGRFDPWRSTGMALLGAAAAYGLYKAIDIISGGGDQAGVAPPGTQNEKAPVFSISIP